ncbi:MAG: tetratricopeptide repeat protein [Thermodesulfobacteriota bacterium]
MTTKPYKILKAVVLAAVVLAVYSPSIHHDFIWDDDVYVTRNDTLADMDGLKKIWLSRGATPQYYPLTFTSFWIERQIFGLDPAVFHFTNIVLHAANAILVWLVLTALGIRWAWGAALLFAVHPVNVESVAWISERKNVLSGLFALASLLLLVRLYLSGQADPRQRPSVLSHRRAGYAAALFLFCLALLSKSVVCVLPAVFLVLVWWKGGSVVRRIPGMLPFFVTGGMAALNTALIEKHYVGAFGPEWDFGFPDRVLIAGRALWFYASKLIYPSNLTFIYPQWRIDPAVWWQHLFPAAALAVLVLFWVVRNRVGRGLFAGTAVFLITLFPALGFVNYYPMQFSFVADHFQYLAGIALLALLADGAYRLTRLTGPKAAYPACLLWAGAGVLLSAGAWQAQDKYQNLQTLWQDTLAKNPGCWMAANNLGGLFVRQGRADKAILCFESALSIKPDHLNAANSLVAAFSAIGDYDRAASVLKSLLEKRPDSAATICYNLACLYSIKGDVKTAAEWLAEAIKNGFSLWELVESDPDLANLRNSPYFDGIMTLRPGVSSPP